MTITTRSCPTCDSSLTKSLDWLISDEKRYVTPAGSYVKDTTLLSQLRLSLCLRCSQVFYSVIPTWETIKKTYEDGYRKPIDFINANRLFTNHRKSILWHSLLKPYLKDGMRILDIGCAEGFFVKFLRDRGYHADGIELNTLSITTAKEKFGLDIVPDFTHLAGNKYDLIFNSGFFEHLENPKATLADIKSHLNPGGLLYIQTPDVLSPNLEHLSQFFPAEHFQTYSTDTLRYFLIDNGLDIVAEKTDLLNFGFALMARLRADDHSIPNPFPSALAVEHHLIEIMTQHHAMVANKDFKPITPYLGQLYARKHPLAIPNYYGNYAKTEYIMTLLSQVDFDFRLHIANSLNVLLEDHGYHRIAN